MKEALNTGANLPDLPTELGWDEILWPPPWHFFFLVWRIMQKLPLFAPLPSSVSENAWALFTVGVEQFYFDAQTFVTVIVSGWELVRKPSAPGFCHHEVDCQYRSSSGVVNYAVFLGKQDFLSVVMYSMSVLTNFGNFSMKHFFCFFVFFLNLSSVEALWH